MSYFSDLADAVPVSAVAVYQVIKSVGSKNRAVGGGHETVAVDAIGIIAGESGILGAEQRDRTVSVNRDSGTEFLVFTALPGPYI